MARRIDPSYLVITYKDLFKIIHNRDDDYDYITEVRRNRLSNQITLMGFLMTLFVLGLDHGPVPERYQRAKDLTRQ